MHGFEKKYTNPLTEISLTLNSVLTHISSYAPSNHYLPYTNIIKYTVSIHHNQKRLYNSISAIRQERDGPTGVSPAQGTKIIKGLECLSQ